MKKYETIDISGDAGLRIFGETLEELFENAARGMYELTTDTSQIEDDDKRVIVFDAESYESMLIKWLNELIFFFDTYNFVGKRYDICISEGIFSAEVRGGYFDPKANEQRLLLKAATYHRLSLKKNDSQWEAEVVFDI
ncbi:MAG: archease [Nitrospirae bacterium]|nr:archease [Nitrospirota bacterium]